jgi:hypothetical protein
LTAAELPKAALVYPIVFAQAEDGLHPFAVLGLSANENLYLEGDAWVASYLPASVRLYPFRFAGERILIDEAAPHFSGEEGAALFDESGAPSAALNEQLAFLRNCYAAEVDTAAWVARMAALGLLIEQDINVVSPQGKRYTLQKFHVIDAAKIPLLPDTVLTTLARDGSLALIHAHLLSLEHLVSLATRRDGLVEPVAELGVSGALFGADPGLPSVGEIDALADVEQATKH